MIQGNYQKIIKQNQKCQIIKIKRMLIVMIKINPIHFINSLLMISKIAKIIFKILTIINSSNIFMN